MLIFKEKENRMNQRGKRRKTAANVRQKHNALKRGQGTRWSNTSGVLLFYFSGFILMADIQRDFLFPSDLTLFTRSGSQIQLGSQWQFVSQSQSVNLLVSRLTINLN